MTGRRTTGSTLAAVVPALSLVGVAAACAWFGLSTAPAVDPSGIAAGQASSLSAPAWITAVLALVAAGLLLFARGHAMAFRAGGILGMSAAIGAALGGLLNLIGYANSIIWWAADPDGIRRAAAILLVAGLVALVIVASEQLRPGWRPRQDSNLRPRD